MLIIEDQQYFDEVVAFAKQAGLYDVDSNMGLKSRLDYLDNYGANGAMRVRLQRDFAPHSFFFVIENKESSGEWSAFMCGGLLFHGPIDGEGSGSPPTFAVTLEPVHGWSIHT